MFSNAVMSFVIINPVHLIISSFVPIIKALKKDNLFLFWFFLLGVQYTDTNIMLTDKLDLDGRTLLVWQKQKRTYNLGNQYTVFLNFLLFISILISCFCAFLTELGGGGPQILICMYLTPAPTQCLTHWRASTDAWESEMQIGLNNYTLHVRLVGFKYVRILVINGSNWLPNLNHSLIEWWLRKIFGCKKQSHWLPQVRCETCACLFRRVTGILAILPSPQNMGNQTTGPWEGLI